MRALAALAIASLLVVTAARADEPEAEQLGCSGISAREACCPSACAIARTNRTKADRVLRSCMAALQCSPRVVASSSVFLSCTCTP